MLNVNIMPWSFCLGNVILEIVVRSISEERAPQSNGQTPCVSGPIGDFLMEQFPGQGKEPKADSQQPPLLLGGFPLHLLHGENEKSHQGSS